MQEYADGWCRRSGAICFKQHGWGQGKPRYNIKRNDSQPCVFNMLTTAMISRSTKTSRNHSTPAWGASYLHNVKYLSTTSVEHYLVICRLVGCTRNHICPRNHHYKGRIDIRDSAELPDVFSSHHQAMSRPCLIVVRQVFRRSVVNVIENITLSGIAICPHRRENRKSRFYYGWFLWSTQHVRKRGRRSALVRCTHSYVAIGSDLVKTTTRHMNNCP